MAEVPLGQPVEHVETIVPGVESIAPTTSPIREPTISATDATLAAELAIPDSAVIFNETMNLGAAKDNTASGEVGNARTIEGFVNSRLSAS